MSSADEPVVEVLTAEVRVLQVGSKPIALSAARQLDVVDAAVIRPFGRVRIDPKPDKGVIEVIGSKEGILVRSSARTRKVECPGYQKADSSYGRGYGLPELTCGQHRNTRATDAAPRHGWTEYTVPRRSMRGGWRYR